MLDVVDLKVVEDASIWARACPTVPPTPTGGGAQRRGQSGCQSRVTQNLRHLRWGCARDRPACAQTRLERLSLHGGPTRVCYAQFATLRLCWAGLCQWSSSAQTSPCPNKLLPAEEELLIFALIIPEKIHELLIYACTLSLLFGTKSFLNVHNCTKYIYVGVIASNNYASVFTRNLKEV